MSHYDDVQEKVYGFMLGAKKYANARKSVSGVRKWDWIDNEDFLGLKYYRPFFRTVEGTNHTMFVVDIDTKIPEAISKRLDDSEGREVRLRAVLEYINDWFKDNQDYRFTTYISGVGLYLVQKLDKTIDKRRFMEAVWSPQINEEEKYDSSLIDKGLFKACVKKLKSDKHKCTSKCDGWHRSGTHEVSRFVNYMNIEVQLIIDLHMYSHVGFRLFRGPYSPYVKLSRPYYCVPLVYNDEGIDITTTLRQSYRGKVELKEVQVFPFQFEDMVDLETTFEKKVEYDRKSYGKLTPIDFNEYRGIKIPEPEDKLTRDDERTLNKMEAKFSDDPLICPPCINNHYLEKSDKFWSKMVTVRYLANKGFNLRDTALFVRFILNDESDNSPSNKDKLFHYLPLAFGKIDTPHRPPSCMKMIEPHGQFNAVTLDECNTCGRRFPLQELIFDKDKLEEGELLDKATELQALPHFQREQEKQSAFNDREKRLAKKIVKDEIAGFKEIREILGEVVDGGKHSELIKTTRCGVTTTLIHLVKERKKKALVIAPTNAIAFKTFPEALEFGKRLYGLDIDGAIFSNNVKSCLKLSIEMKNLYKRKKEEPEWGEYGVRFNDMTFHFKPPCFKEYEGKPVFCKFYDDLFDFPHRNDDIPYPVGSSEITQSGDSFDQCEGYCAYNTIMNNLANYDVLFMTYDKLNAVLSEGSDEAKDLLNFIMNEIDILFFDEISFLAQKPKLVIPLINETYDGVTEEFLDKVKKESSVMKELYGYEYIKEMVKVVDVFTHHIDTIVSDLHFADSLSKSFSYKLKNPLDEEERMYVKKYFGAFHSLLETYTKEENVYLENLEKFVILMQEDGFYISNYQTLDYNYVCGLTCSPILSSIRRFTRTFTGFFNKQVLVTDATMPYIKMSDLLGLDFDRVIVGDPRGTNSHQLIVADNKRVPIVTLINSSKKMFGTRNYMEMYSFINEVCKTHDPKDIMIVLPNSGVIYKKVRDARRKEMIPKGVELTYYRSDKTIGVATTKRVMIAVCTPYPPRFSHIWLANYYKDIGLYSDQSIEELSEKLEKMNAFQTFYQTIGRVKDPSNRVNSVVYLYGIRATDVDKLLEADKDVPRPAIVTIPRKGNREKMVNIVGSMWRNSQTTVSEPTLQLFNYLDRRRDSRVYLSKVFNDLKFNKTQVNKVLNTDRYLLSHLGMTVSKTNRGTYVVEMKEDNVVNVNKI